MEAIGYLASILMGLSLGMIGGGGSILTVPILVYLFKMQPAAATGYSLFIVGLTALVGAGTYYKQKLIDFKTGFIFAAPSFVGVYLVRAYVVPAIPNEMFQVGSVVVTKSVFIMLVFTILMLAASYSMIKTKKNVPTAKAEMTPAMRYFIIAIEGLVVGGVTGLVGAGGGFLIIPALVLLTGMSMKLAVGTSLTIIAIKSLFGFIGDLNSGAQVDWGFMLTISAIAVLGIFIGAKLSKYVPEAKLKKGFGYFVLVMGTVILSEQLMRMF